MKYLIFAAVLAVLTSCSKETQESDDVVEEPAEGIYESVSDTMHDAIEEAEEIESVLGERAEATDNAVEEATGTDD